ncbi:MAG: hypothetical protein KH375_01150 [Alistipes sp.]|nr:hypothetical protein [Alistipes sp.]
MKKILLFALIALTFGFAGCSKDEEIIVLENCTFSIDFAFPTSGEMTKADASSLYDEFYKNYVITKAVAPDDYELTFKKDNSVVAKFSGKWNADLITLPEGVYTVTGTSAVNSEIISKTNLKFNQEVVIKKGITTLSLTAIYDRFLLFVENGKYKSISVSTGDGAYSNTVNFVKTDHIQYCFLSKDSSYFESIKYYGIDDNDYGKIYLSRFNFENGKYYYFDVVSGSFSIPPMEAGEIK